MLRNFVRFPEYKTDRDSFFFLHDIFVLQFFIVVYTRHRIAVKFMCLAHLLTNWKNGILYHDFAHILLYFVR